jgi:hypothetical protein
MNPLKVLAMLKLPPEADQFKHFKGDPPEVKLEAWKQLQLRLKTRDLAICASTVLITAITLAAAFWRIYGH